MLTWPWLFFFCCDLYILLRLNPAPFASVSITAGAPIIMSFPHFYQADEKFVSAIKGMRPNKEEHESFVDINPVSTHSSVKKNASHCVHAGSP